MDIYFPCIEEERTSILVVYNENASDFLVEEEVKRKKKEHRDCLVREHQRSYITCSLKNEFGLP